MPIAHYHSPGDSKSHCHMLQSEQMVGNVALNSSRVVEGITQRVTSYPGVKCYAAPPFALVAGEQMPDAMQH